MRSRLLIALALVPLAACAGSDTSSSSSAPPTEVTQPATTTATTVAPSTEAPSTTAAPDDPAADVDTFVSTVVEASEGVFTEAEARCWADTVLAGGLTGDELAELADNPLGAASVPGAMTALSECVDPTADVDAPFTPDLRDRIILGLTAEGFPVEAANCVIDTLVADGFDARDLLVGTLTGQSSDEFSASLSGAFTGCLATEES